MTIKINHRPEDLEGLHRLALRLINADSHEDLLNAVAEEAMRILVADRGLLLLSRSEGEDPQVVRSWGTQPGNHDVSKAVLDRVMSHGEPLLIEDALADEKLAIRESVQRLEIRSVLAAPLRFGDEICGALYLETTPDLRIYADEEFDIFNRILELSSRALEANTKKLLLEQRSSLLERDLRARYQFPGIVTSHGDMFAVLEMLGSVAATDLAILIQGESGTGKELLARAVYINSRRGELPFQVINCAAIAATLIESELFGHVKGAFTGATQDKKGLIAEVDGGTVFLDEVGELPIELQSKLLRTLQFGEIQRVGSVRAETVDVRFVAATNKRLDQEVEAKRFREDLYFRLNAVVLEIPPLRDRREDILLLFQHFLQRECAVQEREIPEVAERVKTALVEFSWPGNVRQLENEAFRALAMAGQERRIEFRHLSRQLRGHRVEVTALEPLAEVERKVVREHLRRANGNKSLAARTLGLSREGLRKKLIRWKQV